MPPPQHRQVGVLKVLLENVKVSLHNELKINLENRSTWMLMSSFLGPKKVNHTIAFTPVKKEEVPMGRVSLGKSLWKDKDAVNRDYINTPSLTNDLTISIPSHVSAL